MERSTTPLPPQMGFQPTQEQTNFINHLVSQVQIFLVLLNVCHKENKQPVKSALKRPALQKSTNSAFTQLNRAEGVTSESEGYGNSPSPKPQKEWNVDDYSSSSQPPTDFNSPGPSEGGTSVDSGFGKPTSVVKPKVDEIAQQKAREAKIAQNMAKFETLLRSTNQPTTANPESSTQALSSGPLLSSLSQLRLNA